ncbi:unnamed protein product [Ranitomeya imitator]|uniref:DnaJ homolog subfamily C member 2 n=1 Tax=Ranitomeya imitator TaxID=111125 RepID=A0ABN9M7K9_9NEOB|nr:unnamed protein product [Ranitomeya imitator]
MNLDHELSVTGSNQSVDEHRDERRWIEKQNRAARAQRKKEEMNRIRTLVGHVTVTSSHPGTGSCRVHRAQATELQGALGSEDNAYSSDPRIKKFKEEEKARKEAEKKAKADARRKEQEEKEKLRQAELEAARLAKEKEEEEARQQALVLKKEKEIQKKAIKKERQRLRTTCKNWNYFSENEADSVKMMEDVEKLCDRLELISLQSLNEALSGSSKEESKSAVEKQIAEVNAQIKREKEQEEARMRQSTRGAEQSSSGGGGSSKSWSEDDLQLLIKAVNLFPAGTNARWEVIANYMNLHSVSGIKRTAKDVINKAKSLQKLDPQQKDDINKKAFDKFKKEHKVVAQSVDNAIPSERFEAPGADSSTPWTTEEQKLLEQALKTFPVNTPERWEKIADAVPGRSKKDCMKRYKVRCQLHNE